MTGDNSLYETKTDFFSHFVFFKIHFSAKEITLQLRKLIC